MIFHKSSELKALRALQNISRETLAAQLKINPLSVLRAETGKGISAKTYVVLMSWLDENTYYQMIKENRMQMQMQMQVEPEL